MVLVVVAVVAVTIASGFDSSKPSGAAKVTATQSASTAIAQEGSVADAMAGADRTSYTHYGIAPDWRTFR